MKFGTGLQIACFAFNGIHVRVSTEERGRRNQKPDFWEVEIMPIGEEDGGKLTIVACRLKSCILNAYIGLM
jgi:hypothetical protein